MTRQWVSRTDERWVMVCDLPGCTTRSEPFPSGRQPNLAIFRERGWFIAPLFGDRCPFHVPGSKSAATSGSPDA